MLSAGIFIVPSVLIVTPVKPPSLLILILSSIFVSVAEAPSASSTPFPLSINTLAVVPPVTGLNGVPLKSSSSAVIVGKISIVAFAVSHIELSESKQIVYSTV